MLTNDDKKNIEFHTGCYAHAPLERCVTRIVEHLNYMRNNSTSSTIVRVDCNVIEGIVRAMIAQKRGEA